VDGSLESLASFIDIFYTQEISNNTDPNNILVITKRIEVKWCESSDFGNS